MTSVHFLNKHMVGAESIWNTQWYKYSSSKKISVQILANTGYSCFKIPTFCHIPSINFKELYVIKKKNKKKVENDCDLEGK